MRDFGDLHAHHMSLRRTLPGFDRFWCILGEWICQQTENIQKLVWFPLEFPGPFVSGKSRLVKSYDCYASARCIHDFKEPLGSQFASQQQVTHLLPHIYIYIPCMDYLLACIYSKWISFVGTYCRIGTSGFCQWAHLWPSHTSLDHPSPCLSTHPGWADFTP